jgi:hypothetical protein
VARQTGWATGDVHGLAYAGSRPELIGTYVVDIVAMTFAMPSALFPALAAQWGGAHDAGYLFASMSAGALAISLFSGWTRSVQRHGAAVVVAAIIWGCAILALSCARSLPDAMGCLVLAGAADMVSGLFRMTIWNYPAARAWTHGGDRTVILHERSVAGQCTRRIHSRVDRPDSCHRLGRLSVHRRGHGHYSPPPCLLALSPHSHAAGQHAG